MNNVMIMCTIAIDDVANNVSQLATGGQGGKLLVITAR